MSPRTERLLLGAVLLVALVGRLWALGADVPFEVERTHAVYMDAFWSLEAAAGTIDTGVPTAHLEGYDLPVWTPFARTWFRLVPPSLGSAQALGGLCSLLTLLLVWRLLRGTLGPKPALVGAAMLAMLYPSVWLARAALVYVPLSLAMTLAACLWLSARSPAPLEERLCAGRPRLLWISGGAQELLAWALALACAALRPQCAALLVGLALGQCLRAGPRGRRVGFALCGAGALAGLAVLFSPELRAQVIQGLSLHGGDLGERTADRLRRYLSDELGAKELLLRLLHWGGEPYHVQPGREFGFARGSGYFGLAPGLVAAACCGAFLVCRRWAELSSRAREVALVAGGWGLTFVAASLLVHYRPLRYFELLAVPGAVAFAFGFQLLRAPRAPAAWRAWEWGLGLALAAFVGAHLASWLGWGVDLQQLTEVELSALGGDPWRQREAERLLRAQEGATWRGAALGLLLLPAFWLVGSLGTRRHVADGLVVVALAPCALALGSSLARPTHRLAWAQTEAAELFDDGSLATGPLTSVLLLGQPVRRDRGAWFATGERLLTQSCARLRSRGYTHFVLEASQARSSGLVQRLATQGIELSLERELRLGRPGAEAWRDARFLILRIKIPR